ncbi:Ig-like domain-containing protein [Robertkochia sediminum]|uniref:Ig-like domain-containing protein n=1 Tax=Robertkochia sediminum TaxID=2785326 RepID=UPI0019329A20|nr:Ig-like domain-containing protein [Robertkochia sediminum]
MKKYSNNRSIFTVVFAGICLLLAACERDVSDEVEFADFSNNPEVYIDGFSAGLEYLPFQGSRLDAFSVDTEEPYEGTSSMRFDVPNFGDPQGAFAGAIFPDYGGRNLTGYDALTFYAKATKAATINEIGFGNDFGANRYLVVKNNLRVTTNWQKYIIPIPDPSKLVVESGMFWYAEGPEEGDGYSFWVDELKYEKLGTIAQPRPAMFNGEDVIQQSFTGSTLQVTGLTQTFNLPSGGDQTVAAAPAYFSFSSTDPDIARVDESGQVSVLGTGTATITAIIAGVKAAGSLTVESLGDFVPAPVPDRDPATVISVFSDAYTNIPVDFYNGFFEPFQTTLGGVDLEINGDQIIRYTQLNFVATEFKNPTIDASAMTHFHVDIQVQEAIDAGDFLEIELGDFGPDNAFGGGDDSSARVRYDSGDLVSNQWISLDIPLSEFSTLTSRSNLAQIFFISDATISTILVDNMYFYAE